MPDSPPIVLCLSGHDPTGGAGIQADVETLQRLNCHACTVVTALTAQDSVNVRQVYPQAPEDFLAQARLILEDLPVHAVKIGLLGSAGIALAVVELLQTLQQSRAVPVVLDPILAAGGGYGVASDALRAVLVEQLIPMATVMTPNTPEARKLTGQRDASAGARALLERGCPNVLLTGAHEAGAEVINAWHVQGSPVRLSAWPRLPGSYHGSGCTLAAALAGFLALGLPMEGAVEKAQVFAWESLNKGYQPGRGQFFPRR